MAKFLLIVEPSATIQKLFTTTLGKNEYQLEFAHSSMECIQKIFENVPDVLLVNSEIELPDGFELVRMIRSYNCFADLPIGMYSTCPVPFDDFFSNEAGVDNFSYLDSSTLSLTIEELAQIPNNSILDKKSFLQAKRELCPEKLLTISSKLWMQDNYRYAVLNRLFHMMSSWESLDDMTGKLLSAIAELCEAPLIIAYMQENDGVHGYLACGDQVAQNEVLDFIKVGASDFEQIQSDFNISNVQPKFLTSEIDLNRFYNKDVPLSSYECIVLKGKNGNQYGTISIVCSGNFTDNQLEVLKFCAYNGGILLENALFLKQKIFYEHSIRKAFSRFVPEQIIDELASNYSQENVSVGEKREVAILFSDIRSFTNISECNKPEVIVSFLNRYFSIMVEIIKKHGGTIDKFIGDAIMALFGTPISYEDNAQRAVAAAYEMRQALSSVPLEDLVMPENMSFNIGIGIHYGDVIVGSIGSKDKTDYSVIGDSVNLASRLEGLTKTYGTQILVSDSVKNSCEEDSFVFRHLDSVKVKGKAIAVPIYAVDRDEEEFPNEYRDAYHKGMELYTQGIFRLAKEYFEAALKSVEDDKACLLMISRCTDFIENPPESWDGSISFTTK